MNDSPKDNQEESRPLEGSKIQPKKSLFSRIQLTYITFVFTIGFVLFILFLFDRDIIKRLGFYENEMPLKLLVSLLSAITFAVFYFTFHYLTKKSNDNNRSIKIKSNLNKSSIDILNSNKEDNEINIIQNTSIKLSDEQEEKIYRQLIDSIDKRILQRVETQIKYGDKAYRYGEVKINFDRMQQRIIDEIESLNRKSNVNLSIGVATTVSAIGLLFYANYSILKIVIESWTQFLFVFVPKFSIAIFLEIFSFYFLSIYKSNLNEIKYYQNELTDIDFKTITIQSNLLTETSDINGLGDFLIKNYRNRVLKDGESTEVIQSLKEENQSLKSILANFPKLDQFLSK